MYNTNNYSKTTLTGVTQYQAESLENKVHRILTNKEPIKDGAPVIYTDRKDGVQAGFNIRADRFEIAVEATDKITKSKLARRENAAKVVKLEDKKPKEPEAKSGDPSQ